MCLVVNQCLQCCRGTASGQALKSNLSSAHFVCLRSNPKAQLHPCSIALCSAPQQQSSICPPCSSADVCPGTVGPDSSLHKDRGDAQARECKCDMLVSAVTWSSGHSHITESKNYMGIFWKGPLQSYTMDMGSVGTSDGQQG